MAVVPGVSQWPVLAAAQSWPPEQPVTEQPSTQVLVVVSQICAGALHWVSVVHPPEQRPVVVSQVPLVHPAVPQPSTQTPPSQTFAGAPHSVSPAQARQRPVAESQTWPPVQDPAVQPGTQAPAVVSQTVEGGLHSRSAVQARHRPEEESQTWPPEQPLERQPWTQVLVVASQTVEGGLHWLSREHPPEASQRPVPGLQVPAVHPVTVQPSVQLPLSQMRPGGPHSESARQPGVQRPVLASQ